MAVTSRGVMLLERNAELNVLSQALGAVIDEGGGHVVVGVANRRDVARRARELAIVPQDG